MVECVALYRVDETARFTGGRDEIVPAPCGEMAAAPVDAGDFDGNRIEPVEIVQQPSVQPIGGERRLDGRHIKPCGRLEHAVSITCRTRRNRTERSVTRPP